MASGLSRSGSFAPSTLSVLYENQAMKVERDELKSELKLISARVCAKPPDSIRRHAQFSRAQ